MMQVLHLLAHLRLGAGRYITDLAREQARRGHGVHVALATDIDNDWCSDPTLLGELRDGGVKVSTPGDVFRRDLRGLDLAARRLRRSAWEPDAVVHAHTAMAVAVAVRAGFKTVVFTTHGWNPARDPQCDLQDALALSGCRALSSPSTYWAQRVSALTGGRRVSVIPYGFDLRRYPSLGTKGRRLAGHFRVVCVGELSVRKGQDTMLAALPGIWAQAPDVECHFIGSGPAREALERAAAELPGASGRVVFHGALSQPYHHLSGFDLFCLPTRSDNQPVAIVEALLAGLPVLSTKVGGVPEMLAEDPRCRVVRPDDPVALARAVVAFRRRTPIQQEPQSARIATYRRTRDISRHAKRLDRWYTGAMTGPRHGLASEHGRIKETSHE